MTTKSGYPACSEGGHSEREREGGREAVRKLDRMREWLSLTLLAVGLVQLHSSLACACGFIRLTGSFSYFQRLITTRNKQIPRLAILASPNLCAHCQTPATKLHTSLLFLHSTQLLCLRLLQRQPTETNATLHRGYLGLNPSITP
jgi:hypothetical protein